jgi:hypothetical protein
MAFLKNNKALLALVLSLALNALGGLGVVDPVVAPTTAVCP